MKRQRKIFWATLLGLVCVQWFAMASQAISGDSGVKVGMLTCKSIPNTGINLIIHSTVDIKCKFIGTNGENEYYKGETGIGLGIDLKWERDIKVTFTVVAAQFRAGTHQLAGKYTGASAGVTAGAGGGAHVLVGGNMDSVSLRPAVEESKGYALAAGLGYMSLEPGK